MRDSLRHRAVLAVVGGSVLLVAGPGLMDNPGIPSDPLPTGIEVLYDQTNSASGNGTPDQEFEATFSVASSEAADDFEVTAPGGWTIFGVNTIGTYSFDHSSAIHVNITFYPDEGGLPGETPKCEFLQITSYADTFGSFEIDLPAACNLGPGVYWLAQEVRQDWNSSGQHWWSDRNVQNLSSGVWRNPGNKFGTGCLDWTPKKQCGVGGNDSADFLFQILGTVEGDPIPAVGPLGLLLTVLALGGGSGYVLARRR